MKSIIIIIAIIAIVAVLFASCQPKMVMQKAVYQQGKIVPFEKPVAFSMHENDTLTIVKRVR